MIFLLLKSICFFRLKKKDPRSPKIQFKLKGRWFLSSNAPEINIRQTRLMDGSKAKLPFGCKTRNISSRHCFNRIVNILIHCSIRGIACLFNTPATVIITTASSANNTIHRHIASIASTHSLVPWHDNTALPSCIEIFASYITRKHSIWQFSTTIIDFTFHSSSLNKSRNSCGLHNQEYMPQWNKNSIKYCQKTIRSSLAWPVHEMFGIWLMRLAMTPLPNPLLTAG